MRIFAPLTLISLFAGFAAVAATACDLSSGRSCGQYEGCYPGYGSSGGDYGPTPDAAPPPAKCEAFALTFAVPEQSGDCQLVLRARSEDGYSSSSYADPTATYYFAQPQAGETTVPCEAIDGPAIGRCARERNLVVLGSTSTSDVTSLRTELSLGSYESSFEAELSCARVAAPQKRTVTFGCSTLTPATPTTGDAGTRDADTDADTDAEAGGGDGGDGGAEAFAPELLH